MSLRRVLGKFHSLRPIVFNIPNLLLMVFSEGKQITMGMNREDIYAYIFRKVILITYK